MRKISMLLITLAVVSVLASLSAQVALPAGQAPSVPGGVAGAPVPGQPRRDTAAQPQPTGTGRIRGRVVAAVTNAPLRRVQMALQWSENPQFRPIVMTDAEGRYEFAQLPPGKFSLSASKPGYVALQYGQRRPYEGGTSIALNVGETVTSIDFALPRGGVIAGRITDEFGELMPQVQVQAQRFQFAQDGQRRLVTTGTATTDDRGEFRVYGLMPGEYVVNGSVRPPTNFVIVNGLPSASNTMPSDGYPPTFYPGTANANDAQTVTIGIGEEVNIQFGLIAARLARISGTVRDSEGRPGAGEVILLPRQGISTNLSFNQLGADGSFAINGVAAGEYSLEVRQILPGREGPEAASVPITVAGNDIAGLRITTSKGSLITGRVIWDGTAPKTSPLPGPLRVGAMPADPTNLSLGAGNDSKANGELDDSGNFQLGGVAGRVFLTLMTTLPGWTVKSVTFDGQDITDVPLDPAGRQTIDGIRITMTDKLTNVSGQVTDAKGSTVPQYVVVVQPAEEVDPNVVMRYIRTVRPDTNGRFELRALRPGRYVATAIDSLEQGRQASPEFRRQLRRGAREFTIKEGETLSLDLKLTPGF
jgi:Carboxypeptidase regulatory-like domain